MTDHQANRIIELLENIDRKLDSIDSNTSYIDSNTSSIESNTGNNDLILSMLGSISNKLDNL